MNSMPRYPRRKAIAITCLAGALAIGCFFALWPQVRAWWVKREMVARLKDMMGAWNKMEAWNEWREKDPNREINLSRTNLTVVRLTFERPKNMDPTRFHRSDSENPVNLNLSGVNLSSADLSGADLRYANLSGADLNKANLTWADLIGADLSNAKLSGANLSGAKLGNANLSNTDLHDIVGWKTITNLSLTNIYGVKNPPDGFIEFAKSNGAVEMDCVTWELIFRLQ